MSEIEELKRLYARLENSENETEGYFSIYGDWCLAVTRAFPALLSRLEAAEAERRWIPVSERLPDSSRDVNVRGAVFQDVGCHITGKWYIPGRRDWNDLVTHWKELDRSPLPEVEK